MPIILKIRFKDFVTVISFDHRFLLLELGDISHQKVSERVAGGHRCIACIEGKQAVRRHSRLRNFVLLGSREICAELQAVCADDFRYIVAIRVGWIGVQWAVRNVAWVFRKAIKRATGKADAGDLSASAIVEQPKRHVGGPLPRPYQRQVDVVGGIASHKLVE